MTDNPTLDALRAAFVDAGPETDLPCAADLEKIQRAVDGQLPRREFLALVDRASATPGLALAWRLARELRQQLAPAAAPAPALAEMRPAWVRPRTAFAGLALAASVVLAVWLGSPSLGPKRGRSEPAIATILTDGASLPRDRFELTWTAPFAPARYDVDVLNEDLRTVYRVQGIQETHLIVPPGALAGIPSGSTILWRVEALAPSGETVLSPTFVQRLK